MQSGTVDDKYMRLSETGKEKKKKGKRKTAFIFPSYSNSSGRDMQLELESKKISKTHFPTDRPTTLDENLFSPW